MLHRGPPERPTERGRFTDAVLDRARLVGDPTADDPVAAVLADGDADRVNALLHTLVRNDAPDPGDLPEPIIAYLDATIDLPPWADGDRIERAQGLFETWGLQIAVCLFCASLPAAYACAHGAQVLRLTARLDTDARRRVMETGQFLMDVLAPGSLADDGGGRRVIQRVRLMHAAVRQLVVSRAAVQRSLWDSAWGHPINQEDLAGTLLSFGYVPADPLHRLGVSFTDREAEDYLHCWNVIGHQLGVAPELLTSDLTDAGHLVTAIRIRQTAPSAAGTELAAALVALLEELTPTHRADGVVPALVRHLAGDDVADLLGVPSAPPFGRIEAWLARETSTAESHFDHHHRGLARVIEPFARDLLAAAFRHERGGVRAPFAIPTSLAARWVIDPDPP